MQEGALCARLITVVVAAGVERAPEIDFTPPNMFWSERHLVTKNCIPLFEITHGRSKLQFSLLDVAVPRQRTSASASCLNKV